MSFLSIRDMERARTNFEEQGLACFAPSAKDLQGVQLA
jgi:hypothetical protein